jgi:hypothetical protein
VVGTFRRLLSLALVAALMLMNVQAAELHVHADSGHAADAHHHGPASHHHDLVDHDRPDITQVGAVDADDTVVHVALTATSAQPVKQLQAEHDTPVCDSSIPSIVERARIIARAHGPPSTVQHSLRAPPPFLSR